MTAAAQSAKRTTAPINQPRGPNSLSPAAINIINNAAHINETGSYLPYYQLLLLAADFERALTTMPRTHTQYGALEILITWSIAEALDAMPILTVRFWRTLSHHPALCEATTNLLHDEYGSLHHRLQEELTLYGLAQDPETRFENLFPTLWNGPRFTMSGQIEDQIDPSVAISLLAKIGSGDIAAETTSLTNTRLGKIIDALTNRSSVKAETAIK